MISANTIRLGERLPVNASGIYRIINRRDGKIYIGSSRDLRARVFCHFTYLRNGKHSNQYLQFAFNKYGEESFDFEILELCDEAVLLDREQHHIDQMKSANESFGYNLAKFTTSGGKGRIWTEESREKLKRSTKETWDKSPIERRLLVAAAMSKTSRSRRGIPQPEEKKRKNSESQLGSKNHAWGKKRSTASSKYFGVSRSGKRRWQASFQYCGKEVYVGCYGTQEEAALARDCKMIEMKVENFSLNFPFARSVKDGLI